MSAKATEKVVKRYTKKDFDALPMEERAVLVAKDVLLQLKLKALQPCSGTYLRPRSGISWEQVCPTRSYKWDAQKQIDKITEKCEACAIGSVFLSSIRLFDKLKVEGVRTSYRATMINYVEELQIFTSDNLDLIEKAFEEGAGLNGGVGVQDEKENRFNTQYWNSLSSKRLARIMRNVIKNKGTFVPEPGSWMNSAEKYPME
jgi:hypothetical protein